MSPEKYRRACEIFDQVAALDPAARDAHLNAICGDDLELRDHILRTLDADGKITGSFLEGGALRQTAMALADEIGSGLDDAVIGNYRLHRQIGVGGMGLVYDARDLRLDRRVAIKILQSARLHEPERVDRFRQEARAVSRLNHPNIVSIYDADEFQGWHYIATEFVEGKTLRALIAGGQMDSNAIIEIAVQIASALAAAHEAGLVHRDIKPENVMVRPDGIVKVLDFGLAKLTEPAAPSDAQRLRTRPGHVMGTIQYMSPEQVLGRTVDPRSDLFSLGVVLYELAAGVRPFDGPTDGAVFEAIVNRSPPPPSRGRPSVSPELDNLILRSIEKDPELRFQTAGDLRSTIRYLSRTPVTIAKPIAAAKPARRRLPIPFLVAGVALLLAGLLGVWLGAGGARPVPVSFQQLTEEQGEELFPNISPDGKQLFYASAARGKWDIYLKRVGGARATNLTAESNDDDTEPALSPDGSHIAFRSERGGGGIFVMEATGENPHRISEKGYYPSWSRKGDAIAFSDSNFVYPGERGPANSRLGIISLKTGATRRLETGDALQPNWSPHGHRIAYWGLAAGGQRDIFTAPADGSAPPIAVTNDPATDWNPVWSDLGDELYFLSDRGGTMNVWRTPVDEQSGTVRGKPEPVTVPAPYVRHIRFAAGGRLMSFAASQNRVQLFAIDFDPVGLVTAGKLEAIAQGVTGIANFQFSPDGKQLVHDTVGARQEDIWIMNADGTGRRKLTDDAYKDRSPAWSPDGREIVFFSDRSGRYEEWTIRNDGSGLRQRTSIAWPSVQAPVWSSDGSRILVNTSPAAPGFIDSRSTSPESRLKLLPGLGGFSDLYLYSWPTNGDLLLGIAHGDEIVAYSGSQGIAERLNLTGARPVWLPGGRQFLFARAGRCLIFDLASRAERELFSVAPNRIFDINPTPDGKRIFISQMISDADLWLAHLDLEK